ncbi:tetratricopeptide repeat protein [Caldibacillus lycopersici]|uniref:Tetratricopeptide repeat protein n=1 Tax=Perspicuibacillus lycopersici TaxID=1325689 RepID=A0AAE3ISA3_9BACI|nr:tetratricopeptide repeat protein [Perspicuibacillus lycopersici]MCU9613703.1 tetratricopeptide repeat protein [Perspicuibacillus lycopersici]
MNQMMQCIQLLENGELDKAYELLNKIKDSGTEDEIYELAEQMANFGFLEEAASLYQKLLESYPGEGELLISLAEININLDKEEEALLELEKITRDDPSYIEALLLQADLYQMDGLFEVSEQKLLEAQRMAPQEPVIHFALAELYASIGKFAEAVYQYEQVMKEMDEIAGVNMNQRLADVYSTAGEFEKALEYYEVALNKKLDINVLYGYGLTAYQAGLYQTAIQKLTEVIELDPEYGSAYLPLARAYEHEEELDNAIEVVKKGMKTDPFNKEIHYFAGKISAKLGNESDAEKFLREAIAIDSTYIEAILTINKLLLSQDRYHEIIEIVEPIISDGEEDPDMLWDFARACREEERYSDALNSYRKAYSYLKNNDEFLQNYGFFLLEEGIIHDAIEIFKQLQKNDPTNVEYIDVLERLESSDN